MAELRAKLHLLKQYNLDRAQLRAAVQADPAVRAEAEDELAAVDPIPRERSVTAYEYAEILREALENE